MIFQSFYLIDGAPGRLDVEPYLEGATLDELPRLHEPAPGLYMTVGYNGRGIAPSTFWGKALAERIADGRPAEDMPLPSTPVRPIGGRVLWQATFEALFSTYRLRNLLR